jgi:hypothetical protein
VSVQFVYIKDMSFILTRLCLSFEAPADRSIVSSNFCIEIRNSLSLTYLILLLGASPPVHAESARGFSPDYGRGRSASPYDRR